MQLIKSRIVSQQQLDGSETITITDSKLIRCQHGKYKLFVSHDDGSVKSLCIGEDGSFGKVFVYQSISIKAPGKGKTDSRVLAGTSKGTGN